MFGWEYPPHILGGLGTASFGITEGLHEALILLNVSTTLCLLGIQRKTRTGTVFILLKCFL